MKVTSAFVLDLGINAINCGGNELGQRNRATIKKIGMGKETVPYVSGQAWRKWVRDVLAEKLGWSLSPRLVGENVELDETGSKLSSGSGTYAYTDCDPISYPDDDLFGYMRAESSKRASSGTVRRISPFRSSAIVALKSNVSRDYGTQSNVLDQGSALFEREVYVATMAGTFTIDLDRAGVFEIGLNRDMDAETVEKHLDKFGSGFFWTKHDVITLDKQVRAERVAELLKAISMLEGGANLTRNLTDVTPQAMLLALTDRGNAILEKVFRVVDGDLYIDIDRLDYLYKLGAFEQLHFAAVPGVVKNADEVTRLAFVVVHSTIDDLTQAVADQVENHYNGMEYSIFSTDSEQFHQFLKQAMKQNKSEKQSRKSRSRREQERLDLSEDIDGDT